MKGIKEQREQSEISQCTFKPELDKSKESFRAEKMKIYQSSPVIRAFEGQTVDVTEEY